VTATTAIGIMCKAPQPGRTKTRLAARIGPTPAAELSACFLRDIAAAIDAIPHAIGRRGFAVYAPAGAEPILRGLLPPEFGFFLQQGRHLGEALLGATRGLLAAGHGSVLLVNGDSPSLPSKFLLQAIETLRAPGDRVVLGPASDGGYYLIGLKVPHERLFSDIDWGTASVFRQTCERAGEIGLEVGMLPEWYDVDDEETLGWLRDELAGRSARFRGGGAAVFTKACLAKMAGEPG
jgi:uncharacterized protein